MRSMARSTVWLLCSTMLAGSVAFGAEGKKVAIFPLAGSTDVELREKVAFALRSKLSREGSFDVLAGETVKDFLPAEAPTVAIDRTAAELAKWTESEKPAVLIWGELNAPKPASLVGATLRLKVWQAGTTAAAPVLLEKTLADPTELRSAVEAVLQSAVGAKPATQPNEIEVVDDDASRIGWEKNPNLITNGDFARAGAWEAILQDQKYSVERSERKPAVDKVAIVLEPGADGKATAPANLVLAMNLSKATAESTGLACLSDAIAIRPGRRYRLSFRYKSDAPATHVFVKGYTAAKDTHGNLTQRECYRLQVKPTGATHGHWLTVVCDINPYHASFDVQQLRVDLFAYLAAGAIEWDDVVVKEIGELTKQPMDEAAKKPVEAPGR